MAQTQVPCLNEPMKIFLGIFCYHDGEVFMGLKMLEETDAVSHRGT